MKKRAYYGNTSMEAGISLLMANQTLVRVLKNFVIQDFQQMPQAAPGKIIYDPFMGTGSMAYVCVFLVDSCDLTQQLSRLRHTLVH